MRRLISVLFVCCYLSGALPVAAAPAASLTSSPEQRVLAAMRLWGDVRFFDPALTREKIDWDAAFLRAEPAIASATTLDAYRAAINEMLAPLHDPATSLNTNVNGGSGQITATMTGDDAVITLPADATEDQNALMMQAAKAVSAAKSAHALVFDLRAATADNQVSAYVATLLFSGYSPFKAFWHGSIALPRERERGYLGYPTNGGGYQFYFARDRVNDASAVAGTAKRARPMAFLVSSKTILPPLAIALAQAGAATIFTTGGQPQAPLPSMDSLQLTDGLSVSIRTSDMADVDEHARFATAQAATPQAALQQLHAHPSVAVAYAGPPLPKTLYDRPYAKQTFPPLPMRLLAIARAYNVIRYFSPYRDLMHDDWDAAALQAIDDETRATDARGYVMALMKFYAHLHDSHGFVGGTEVNALFGAGPPFIVRYLHGRAVVTQLLMPSALKGLHVGDVIDDVDGVPVDRAMKAVGPYLNASTPQAARASALRAAYMPSVFSGKADTTLRIRVHSPGSRAYRTLTVTRVSGLQAPEKTGPVYRILPGNVGYVDFDRLEPGQVDAMFSALRNTRAIVFDNRGYPRGAAWAVAPRLTTRTNVRLALFNTPLVNGPLDVDSGAQTLPVYRNFYQMLGAASGPRYLKPTVMLIDERSVSQSEHSALFFRAVNGTRFVGTPTNGADGDVTQMVAPGGVALYFSGEGVRYPDGKQLQRVGIQPDVRVEPKASDIAHGNDVVLQAGLREALRLSHASAAMQMRAVREEAAHERAAFVRPPAATAPVAGTQAHALGSAWAAGSAKYAGSTQPAGGAGGGPEITLTSVASAITPSDFGTYAQTLDVKPYLGKTIRVSGFLSTQNVTGGAGFWLRIDGPSRQFDNMQNRWLSGTTAWKPFAIVLHVPQDATGAVLGLLLVGTGTVHGSRLTVDVVPDTTPTTAM